MKASVPDRASSPMPSGLGFASGAFVAPKSGTSYPTHLPRGGAMPVFGSGGFTNVGSHQIHRFGSLYGLPRRSADPRLYITRRFAGHADPHLTCALGTPHGSGSLRDVRYWSHAGQRPQYNSDMHVLDRA